MQAIAEHEEMRFYLSVNDVFTLFTARLTHVFDTCVAVKPMVVAITGVVFTLYIIKKKYQVRTMNKKLITLMAAALALLSASGQVNFTGTGAEDHHFISITPETSTGLNKIYVIYDTDGVSMTYRASTDEPVVWQSFDSRGGAYAEDIPGIKYDGSTSTLDQVLPNKGYIIYEGTRPFYCWVINYAEHEMSLNDMFFNSDLPCSLLTIRVDGIAHKIPYSTINGRAEVLDREITLSYNTLVWNDSTLWQENPVIETFESLDGGIQIDPPLCNTVFMLSGDRFL